MKSKARKITSLLMALALMLGLFAAMPLTAYAVDHTWNNGTAPTVTDGQTVEIQSGASGTLTVPANTTVTITGSVAGATNGIILSIGANAKVIWEADYSRVNDGTVISIHNMGSGEFQMTAGTISLTNEATTTAAIVSTGPKVTISGGTVNATAGAAIQAGGNSISIEVTNGSTVTATTGTAISSGGFNNFNVKVSGGTVSANSGTAIHTSGASSTVTVSGGTVSNNSVNATIVTSGTVTVDVGTVKNMGATAISADGDVTVSGGTVSGGGSGYAIYVSSGDVAVSGGTVSSASADSTINAAGDVAISQPAGATTAVSNTGAGKAINATSISSLVEIKGGTVSSASTNATINSNKDVTVSNTGEVKNTGPGSAIIASESVTISGGKVESSVGTTIIANTVVNVSAGIVSNTGSGKAIDASGSVTVSGGTVKTESTTDYCIESSSSNVILSGGYVVAGRINSFGDVHNSANADLIPVTITGLPNGSYDNPAGTGNPGFIMDSNKAAATGYNKAWMPEAASQTYTVNVGGTNYTATGAITNTGLDTLSFTAPAGTAPAITTQPANKSITSGQNTTFTVAASGTPAPTYQWQVNSGGAWSNVVNGGIYSGAATATLTLTGVPLANSGYQYRCVATNAAGNATSNAATLTVTNGGGGGGTGGGGGGSTTTNASLSQTKADFDKNGGKDISVTLNKGGYTLQNLKNGSYTLKSGTDYTVNGNTVTIKAAYLSTLAVGGQTITFDMSGGTDPKLTVTVKDTTPAKTEAWKNPFTDVRSCIQ